MQQSEPNSRPTYLIYRKKILDEFKDLERKWPYTTEKNRKNMSSNSELLSNEMINGFYFAKRVRKTREKYDWMGVQVDAICDCLRKRAEKKFKKQFYCK